MNFTTTKLINTQKIFVNPINEGYLLKESKKNISTALKMETDVLFSDHLNNTLNNKLEQRNILMEKNFSEKFISDKNEKNIEKEKVKNKLIPFDNVNQMIFKINSSIKNYFSSFYSDYNNKQNFEIIFFFILFSLTILSILILIKSKNTYFL